MSVRGMRELGDVVVFATCACLMPCAAGSDYSSVVDIFNVRAGTWSTAALSQARRYLAATSLPDARVAIFAAGGSTCSHVDFLIFAYFVVRVGEWDA